MLGKKLHIGAKTTHFIGGSRHTMNGFRSRKWRAQVGAHQHFALPFCSKSRATQRGIEIGIDAGTYNIRAMIVERIAVAASTKQLKTVVKAVPIDRRTQLQKATFRSRLQRRIAV